MLGSGCQRVSRFKPTSRTSVKPYTGVFIYNQSLTNTNRSYKISYMKHESKTQQEAFRMEKARLNLSNREAAEKVGVTKQMINTYEHDGKTELSRTHKAFLPLCTLYGLDPEEIGKMIDKQRAEEIKAK